MPPILGAQQSITVGEHTVINSPSPNDRHEVVFEGDTSTGYFYAVSTSGGGQEVVDALHIYSVDDVADRTRPSDLVILWSPDGDKACLLLNRQPRAAFDFGSRRGYSLDEFPEPGPGWTRHPWDASLRAAFFS